MIKTRAELNIFGYHFPLGYTTTAPLIVVIGDRPTESLHTQIMEALAGGTPTTIDYGLLMQLFARKREENAKGEYREHHRKILLKRKPKRQKNKRNPRHRGKK